MRSSTTWRQSATSSAGSCRSSLTSADVVTPSAPESARARSMSASPTRTCRRLSSLSMVPPRRREAARLARTVVRASQGRGASPARERIACARARAPVARHPGGATRHRSGSAMGSASGADKRYLVRCAHKIGCLPRETIINAYIDSRLALIYHLH